MDFGNGKFRLVAPNEKHEALAGNYIADYCCSANVNDRAIFFSEDQSVYGSNGLFTHTKDYGAWLKWLELRRDVLKVDENIVPTLTFFLMREEVMRVDAKDVLPMNAIVGMISLRPEMNDVSWEYNGSIGYNVRPSMRGRGYSKIGLFLALCTCQKHGLESVLLTCNKTNLASAQTIRALDGRLIREKHFHERQYILQFFTIDVENAIAKHEAEYAPWIAEWPN